MNLLGRVRDALAAARAEQPRESTPALIERAREWAKHREGPCGTDADALCDWMLAELGR